MKQLLLYLVFICLYFPGTNCVFCKKKVWSALVYIIIFARRWEVVVKSYNIPGGGTLRKIGSGSAARFPKPLPYL